MLAGAYQRILTDAGYAVQHAFGAQDAIDIADEHLPSVVILETQIAEHDGIEFLHEFRSYPEWKDIPVIINSRLRLQSLPIAREILKKDLGVTECLYKPQSTLAELVKSVAKVT